MKKALLFLSFIALTGFSLLSFHHDKVAITLSLEDIKSGIYEESEYQHVPFLGNKIRGGDVFDSPDEEFSIGGMELIMDENTITQQLYENFPRNEFMFFTSGGMKLIDEDGYEVEAKTGEMIFIPKGWTGTRIFTGETLMQKFSAVYYQNNDSEVAEKPKALAWTMKDLSSEIYQGSEFMMIPQLKSEGRGANLYKSTDDQFSIGGSELVIGEDFVDEASYEDFPRNEFMYFTQGGIKLIDEDGTVSEAGVGEVAFIPQGWTGTRIFTGDEGIQKFSIVYTEE